MKKLILCVMICLFGVGFSLAQTLTSPDGNLVMDFHLSADKTPVYSLKYTLIPQHYYKIFFLST